MPKASALKLAGLSPATFYYSLAKVKNACTSSPLELCRRRHPLQLSIREIGVIRKLMLDTSKSCWPALSIFHHARRNNMLLINQSTFYKYLRVLGIHRKQRFKTNKRVGIKTNRPNEFLHVDTTFFTLPDGLKMATVFVSDNFSRHILGFQTSTQHDFENVKAALQMAFATIREHYPDLSDASMVVDGGGENNAAEMEGFLLASAPPVFTKLIAQKNIAYSNSQWKR
ncbi:MAG: DDE-type integrase/transposase/recombinase [Owenweeksia sp.]|nr:DDE-type integrase/transposase/recombinase [Owenweeksia sp.]